MQRAGKRKYSRQFWKAYLFLLPVYILLLVFKYWPFAMAVEKSFSNWNGANVDRFIGLGNYLEAIRDRDFLLSLQNAFVVLLVYILISVTIPFVLAELVFAVRSLKTQYALRTAFTFTMVVPGMITILIWKWILGGETGIFNTLLKSIGLSAWVHPWLGDAKTALGSILMVGFPWIGIAMLGGMPFLIYFGALQSIPGDLFDVARIDKVSLWQRILFIDLPMLKSQFKIIIALTMINALQVFDAVFVLTKGGPGTASMVPAVHIYQQAFNYNRMGYASALGVSLFALILALTFFNHRFMQETDKLD